MARSRSAADSHGGTFRARRLRGDLAALVLTLPPLRERVAEIDELSSRFARETAERLGKPCPKFSEEAMSVLRSYAWPGNIRELRNTIERAVLLCDGATIEVRDLPTERVASERKRSSTQPPAEGRTQGERDRIMQALRDCAGNQSRAAKLLGISRRTLVNRLDEFAIERPRANSRSMKDD